MTGGIPGRLNVRKGQHLLPSYAGCASYAVMQVMQGYASLTSSHLFNIFKADSAIFFVPGITCFSKVCE